VIITDIKNLNKRSNIIIDVICDDCKKKFNIKYINYHRNGNKDGFYYCKSCKTKKTNLEKWGVENPSQLKEVKEKKRETFIQNWGVDHPSKSNIIKEKKKETYQDRFGVDNPFQSGDIKEKIKTANIINLGVENPSQSEKIKEKKRETFIQNWGVDHPLKSIEIKEKIISSNLEKWGVKWTLQNDKIKENIKSTNLNLFGVDNPMKNEDIRQKVVKNNLEKWGVDYYYQTDEFKEKSKETLLKNWGNEFIHKSEIYRKGRYKVTKDVNYIKYLNDKISLFKCNKGLNHLFKISSDNYIQRIKNNIPLCTICNPISDLKSIKEKELFEFIKSTYDGEIIQSWRNGLEIDIYLPELNLGFEFNGLYYHSDKYKDKWYHLNKTKHFEEMGIRIIHIWEDDWISRCGIIKSQIKNLLNKSERKIFARKCYVKEIKDSKISNKFLENNHIQGRDYSVIKIGLFFNEELVSVMTFNKSEGRKKMEDSGWNLSRFCNKINLNIIGGASKLLIFFIKKYSVKRIVSYADRDWSIGNLYFKLGFDLVSENNPDYKYIIENKRIHKSRFRKSKTGLSESELDLLKIWDCGKLKFEINM
jgi:hypothetical protein